MDTDDPNYPLELLSLLWTNSSILLITLLPLCTLPAFSLHPCGRKQPSLSTVFWVWLYCTSLIWAAMALTGSFGFSGPDLRPSAVTSPIPPTRAVSVLSPQAIALHFQIRHEWPNFQAHPVRMTLILWKRKIASVVEDVEKLEHSYVADGNVKGCSCCEKQCSGSSKT